jgi:hypothetical protein
LSFFSEVLSRVLGILFFSEVVIFYTHFSTSPFVWKSSSSCLVLCTTYRKKVWVVHACRGGRVIIMPLPGSLFFFCALCFYYDGLSL